MALPQFVTRRAERLYYRRAFPQDLWHITGRAPFAMSLRTSDPQEALRARPAAEREYARRVDAARAEAVRLASATPLTTADATRLAQGWFREAVDAWGPQPRETEELLDARDLEILLEIEAREALSLGHDNERTFGGRNQISKLAERLLKLEGLESDPAADAVFEKLLRRAEIAMHQVRGARLMGDYGTRPDDPLFASALEAPEDAPAGQPPNERQKTVGRTVADLEAAFRAARPPSLSPASEAAYVPVFRLLREVTGESVPLASLNHDQGQRLFDAVQGIPSNAQKTAALQGLSLTEQIAEGKRLGLPRLRPKRSTTVTSRAFVSCSRSLPNAAR